MGCCNNGCWCGSPVWRGLKRRMTCSELYALQGFAISVTQHTVPPELAGLADVITEPFSVADMKIGEARAITGQANYSTGGRWILNWTHAVGVMTDTVTSWEKSLRLDCQDYGDGSSVIIVTYSLTFYGTSGYKNIVSLFQYPTTNSEPSYAWQGFWTDGHLGSTTVEW